MAALGMVLGASFAGKKSMTSTSGPGFSLMEELIGLAIMAEIPCVIVDVQRAGPSTGMPTRHEQGDLYLAALGGHGEVPRIVIAPTSVEDCFYQTINAFNLAEKYQMPVILLSDTVLAVRTESIPKPDLSRDRRSIDRLTSSNGDGNGARPQRRERLRALRADRERRLADGHPRHGGRPVRRHRPGAQHRRPAALRREDPSTR